jgi:carbonic anhydrase
LEHRGFILENPILSRRHLLHGAACACAAMSVAPLAGRTFAATAVTRAELSADQGLILLKEGNDAFVKGACAATGAPARIGELARGQAPFAIIVGCSDSRTPPEQLFSRGLGELFTMRVAGNTVDAVSLGSIEYGLVVLGAPLVVVLGHTQCGAVDAAVKAVRSNAKFPGSMVAWSRRSFRPCAVSRAMTMWSTGRCEPMFSARWRSSSLHSRLLPGR